MSETIVPPKVPIGPISPASVDVSSFGRNNRVCVNFDQETGLLLVEVNDLLRLRVEKSDFVAFSNERRRVILPRHD